MNLYRRTLFIIGAVLIGLLIISWALSYTILIDGFVNLEKNRTILNVERTLNALDEKLAFLNTSAHDWAAWDDTYAFIQDGNKNYIEANLQDTTFKHLGLNLMLFINSNNQVAFGKAFDLEGEREVPLPQGVHEHLYTGAPLLNHTTTESSVAGIILLPDGPMLVASRPILPSDERGPIRGSLIMGRYLDAAEVENLVQTMELPIALSRADDTQIPADFQIAGMYLSEKMPVFVKELSSDTIAGYGLKNDIYGKPALILRVVMPREIYSQGKATINSFLIMFLLAGLMSGIIALLVLDRLILFRLAGLSRSVAEVGKGGDLSARVPVTGNDEISRLADGINEMLARLERSQTALSESEARFKNIVDNAGEAIVVLQDGGIRYSTPRLQELTGYSRDDLASRHFMEFVHPDDREIAIRRLEATLKNEELSPPYHTYRIIKKDGSTIWVEIRGTPIIWDGKPAVPCLLLDVTERKKAEDALRDSEEKYRLLVNNANEAIMVLQDGTVKFANARAKELSGYSDDELGARPFVEFIHVADRNLAIERHLAVLSGKELSPVSYVYRVVTKGGNIKLAETKATKILWDGRPAALVFMIDVTERMQMKEALKQSEDKYWTILEEIEDHYFETDLAGNITFVNDATCRSLGYSKEELVGMSYKAFTVGKHVKDVYEAFNSVYRTGKPVRNITWELVRKDGVRRYVEASVSPLRDEKGDTIGFRGVGRDVTARKQAEEALKRSEERYRSILEDMEEFYHEGDLQGNATFFNDATCNLLGYSREELIGMNYRTYVVKEDAEAVYNASNKVFRTGEPIRDFCFRVARKDGSLRFLEASIFPSRNEAGKIVGFRLVGRDITGRKLAEQQMLVTSKLASIGELAAGVAHELNNPLTGIIGYAELLIENERVPLEIKSDLKKIYQESQRAARIVHNLLSFARQHKPEKSLVDVNELIRRTVEMRSYRFRTSNIKVHLGLSSDLPLIMADPYQIQQVLLNILVNAEQALAEVKRQGKIWVTSSLGNGYIRVSIADNGPGIPEENISTVFHPFFTTKEVGQGTGLGLSVCHGIIAAHNGNITVESGEGKGAKFIIELPIINEGAVAIAEKSAVEEPSYQREANWRILIVDDEPSVRESLARFLSEKGYLVDSAGDAKTALAKIAQNGYDLCIIDLKMPKTDGAELYKIIKSRYPSSVGKVVFITGDTITPATQDFLDFTGMPYLAKPFNFGELFKVVREILKGGR